MKKENCFKNLLIRIFLRIVLVLITLATAFPLYYVIISSFTPGNSLFMGGLIPKKLTMDHYYELFAKKDFALWYANTLKVAFCTMILTLFFVICTAYILSQFRFKGRKAGLMLMLVMTMFPSFMGLVAVYIILNLVHLLDSHWGLILVYAGGLIPGLTWLVKGYFDGISRSFSQAARVDGAGNWTVFFKIMMPISVPIMTFVAVSSFITPWMDYIFARLVLRSSSKQTLAIGLYNMASSANANNEFTVFAAGSVLVAIPITILYMALQKYMIQGISEGASKA